MPSREKQRKEEVIEDDVVLIISMPFDKLVTDTAFRSVCVYPSTAAAGSPSVQSGECFTSGAPVTSRTNSNVGSK